MKSTEETIRRRPRRKEVVQVYNQKGLNGVYSFLRKNGIDFEKQIYEFGLETNKKARAKKADFVNPMKLQFHYYSQAIRSRKTNWSYNRIRAIKIIIL